MATVAASLKFFKESSNTLFDLSALSIVNNVNVNLGVTVTVQGNAGESGSSGKLDFGEMMNQRFSLVKQAFDILKSLGRPTTIITDLVNAFKPENIKIKENWENEIKPILTTVKTKVSSIIGRGINLFASIPVKLREVETKLWFSLNGLRFSQIKNTTKNFLKSIWNGIKGVEEFIVTGLKSVKNAFNPKNIKQTFSSLSGLVSKLLGESNASKKARQILNPQVASMIMAPMGNIAGFAKNTVKEAMDERLIEEIFVSRTGDTPADTQVGADMFNYFKNNAINNGFDVKESLQGVLSFMPVAKDSDQLNKLTDFAYRLNTFDTNGNGLTAAFASIKDAMEGNVRNLAWKFNINEQSLGNFNLEELSKKSDKTEFIAAFGQLLEHQRMGTDRSGSDALKKSPAKQVAFIQVAWKSKLADIGQGALQALSPFLDKFTEAWKGNAFEPFFNMLKMAFEFVGMVIESVSTRLLGFITLLTTNWEKVKGVIFGVLTGLAVVVAGVLIPALWAMLAPIFMAAFGFIVANLPLILMAVLIGFLVTKLLSFGVTAETIIGFVAGTFMMLFGFLINIIMVIWNLFASFAEFFINLFNDPVYAVQKLFYDLAMTFGGMILSMLQGAESFAGGFMSTILDGINKVLKGFNWLSSKIKNMTGVDLGEAELFNTQNVHAVSDKFKEQLDQASPPVPNKNVVTIPRANYLDLGNEFKYGSDKGSSLTNKVTNALKNPPNWQNNPFNSGKKDDAGNNLPDIGNVDRVGQIDDTVDVESEDIKVMRDLAEIQSIQNFVSLTPTVQVTTGDIHNPTDAEEIIRRIEEVMVREVTNSAQGVYG